jgi:hypothetical protein
MALRLPGERPPRFLELLLAAVAVCICALGCASPSRTRRFPSSIFQAARLETRGGHRSARAGGQRPAAGPPREEGAALVERVLHESGLRFGTDGSARALWGYMRTSHQVIAPAEAHPGDIVFFDTRGTGPELDCADHAGIVESVDGDGRLGFLEARGGQVRHSFVDPQRPVLRRGERGQILNSFLRPKKVDDAPEARYFAGEMLCGLARATRSGR